MEFTMTECLEKASISNGWKDWNDVVFTAENRRTIQQIVEEAIELFEGHTKWT